ncbi:MAG: hypothetical protein LC785_12370 [Acidobacteria bacterium]|nr:hypothetical protein [Acidobacteriota bacterium]MCA1642714.1 hypothetical protein [Acidobacteriota bacterium]
MTLSPGTKLGRYEIRSQLGEGGMGEVYLAQDARLRRKVALKILPADFVNSRERLRRFEQKAYQERSWWLLFIKMDLKLDGLRPDARFTDLMRRVRSPQ